MKAYLEAAIDALVDLEGTVYPNGLPSELCAALAVLRRKLLALPKE